MPPLSRPSRRVVTSSEWLSKVAFHSPREFSRYRCEKLAQPAPGRRQCVTPEILFMEPHHVVTSIAGILQLLLIAQVLGSVGTVLLTVVFHNLALRSIGQIKAPDPAPGFIVQVCLKFEGVEAHTSEFKSAQRLVSRFSADPRNIERCTQPRRPPCLNTQSSIHPTALAQAMAQRLCRRGAAQ